MGEGASKALANYRRSRGEVVAQTRLLARGLLTTSARD